MYACFKIVKLINSCQMDVRSVPSGVDVLIILEKPSECYTYTY